MSPCCHGLVNKLELTDCESDTTSEPDRIMTRTPGHHATNPAKNPQNGPRALWVHTYSEPSSGNMRPSWEPPSRRSCPVRRSWPGRRSCLRPWNTSHEHGGGVLNLAQLRLQWHEMQGSTGGGRR